jgi:hypothetical protein
LFPAVVSPENEEKRHADHHRADDHQDETNGVESMLAGSQLIA